MSRKRKNPEIEKKVWERYPFQPDEKTCSDKRNHRNGLREMYRIRLTKELGINKTK